MNIDCVILAAGFSSRMGRNKMILNIDGSTIIEKCLNAFYKTCSNIFIVTGKYHNDIKKFMEPYSKVHIIYNKDFCQGMFSSVKTGIRCIESERFFITPGDYPFLQADTIECLKNTPGNYIVPIFQNKEGHPILLHNKFIPDIINSSFISLRDYLKTISAEKQKIHVENKGILIDIDTFESYKSCLSKYLYL